MQAIKDKLSDLSHMRKAKADAKEEEKEEKELAKTRVQVAKEIRMAREAEAAMDLHVNKAAEKVAEQEAKSGDHHQLPSEAAVQDPHGHSAASKPADGSGSPDYSTGAHSLI